MVIESHGFGAFIIVLIMAVVTLCTRWGGVFVMTFVPISRRVHAFISAMSGSVLIAILAPMAATGDMAARTALATTAVFMLISKKPLPSIAVGVAAAAFIRWL